MHRYKVIWHAWYFDRFGGCERTVCHLYFDDEEKANDYVVKLLEQQPSCDAKIEQKDDYTSAR